MSETVTGGGGVPEDPHGAAFDADGGEADEVVNPQWGHWFEQERTAFAAFENGDHATAARLWTELLEDPEATAFFGEEGDALIGIVTDLVEAHRQLGADAAVAALLEKWGPEVGTGEPASVGSPAEQ